MSGSLPCWPRPNSRVTSRHFGKNPDRAHFEEQRHDFHVCAIAHFERRASLPSAPRTGSWRRVREASVLVANP